MNPDPSETPVLVVKLQVWVRIHGNCQQIWSARRVVMLKPSPQMPVMGNTGATHFYSPELRKSCAVDGNEYPKLPATATTWTQPNHQLKLGT